ncbi:hypothetical protein V2J09_000444 [Rumex salicifolius]
MNASSAAHDSAVAPMGAASILLDNLPSRGLMSSAVLSLNLGGMREYNCDSDTLPPEDQIIKTNQTNILIRALTLRRHKGDTKAATSAEGSRKRTSERALDGRALAKKAMTNTDSSGQREGSSSGDKDYQGLTVERLRALLREKGLSPKGKKDELIARLRSASK